MNSKEALETLTDIGGCVGSDDGEIIEKTIANVALLIDWVKTVDSEIEILQNDVTRLNERSKGLQKSNNELMRELAAGYEEKEKIKEPSVAEELASMF